MNALLLMMGGSGTRFGASRPKQYTLINRIPLFAYIIRKINTVDFIDRVIIVSHKDWLDYVNEWCETFLTDIPYSVVHGGDSRSESVLFGLDELSKYAEDKDIVLLHDATHPYVDVEGMREVIEAVKKYGGATLANGNYDTVYQQNEDELLDQVLQRDKVMDGASPEAFFFGDIYPIYKNASQDELDSMTSAGAIALAHHIPMKVVPMNELNLKITHQEDMNLFLKLCDNYFFDSEEVLTDGKMEVVKAFDQLCKDNGLEYFMTGDMLIGCMHYKAMVSGGQKRQWRIGMLRVYYDKLLDILPEQSERYNLWNNVDLLGKTTSMLSIGKEVHLPEGEMSLIYDITIIPFDTEPRGEDLQDYYLRIAKRRNKRLNKIYVAKGASFDADLQDVSEVLRDEPGAVDTNVQKIHVNRIEKFIYRHFSTQDRYQKLVKWAKKYQKQSESKSAEYRCVVSYQSNSIQREQLYPLVRRKFEDMMLPGPNDCSTWTTVMTPEVEERVNRIQQEDLRLLKEFDRICRKIGVKYFLCGGSMLGYVRDHGFIPWDDDVDVGMLRKDYNIFLRECNKYLDQGAFFLQTRESDPEIPYLFSKIRENHTEYITEYNERRNYHKGICLDIFPFDVLPDNTSERNNFIKQVKKLSKRHNYIVNRCIPEPVYDHGPRSLSELWARLYGKCYRKFWKSFSLEKTQQRYLECATKYDDRELTPETTVASFVPDFTYIKIKQLLPIRDVNFEGITTMMMNKPEDFLTMQYGDYMQYPPEHKRMGHDLIRWSVDTRERERKHGN